MGKTMHGNVDSDSVSLVLAGKKAETEQKQQLCKQIYVKMDIV